MLADKSDGSLRLIVALVLYIATLPLRYKHAQRHQFQHEMCTERTLVGKVTKGKVLHGAAFYVAGPTHECPGRRTFGHMYDCLKQRIPDADYMVPDLRIPRGGSVDATSDLIEQPMSYHKFTGCLRSMAMRPPLELAPDEAKDLSTYSLRRKLASVADRVQLPFERRAELGDWRDRVSDGKGGWVSAKEPMCVRYSATRLETPAMARRVCLQAMYEVSSAGGTNDEQVRDHADHAYLHKAVMSTTWGTCETVVTAAVEPDTVSVEHAVGALIQPLVEEDAHDDPSSSGTDSQSIAASTTSNEGVDPDEVRWLLPRVPSPDCTCRGMLLKWRM